MEHRSSDDMPEPGPAPFYPQYGATPPPPPRKRHTGRWVVGSLFLLIILVALVTALGGTKQDSPAAVSTTSAPPALISPAAGDVASQAPVSVAPPSPTPPATQVVLTFTGDGTKTSKTFTTGDDWSIKYTFDCSTFGSAGNFQVYTYTGGSMSGIPVNELKNSGNDTTYQHNDSGMHYLEVNSECGWTVTVTDGDSGQ